jgi:transposase-like protein
MLKDNRIIKRYSESFRLKILSELETGKYNKKEICHIYRVAPASIDYWIKKYGKFNLFNKRIRIETMDELGKIKKLEEEIRQLKELLIDKEIKSHMNDAYLGYAAKRLGYKNIEELKKKLKR